MKEKIHQLLFKGKLKARSVGQAPAYSSWENDT